MLTAKLPSGELISLANISERKALESLRKEKSFCCPICSSKLILKLGELRIPHFAHEKHAACTEDYERESEYHLLGKLKLYKWLQSQGLSPDLEYYFSEIKQRADIAFQYEGKTYCLEYQCSTISPELFRRRTEGFRKIAATPIWILGGMGKFSKRRTKLPLTSFQYLFLRPGRENVFFLPSYCPETNQFTRLENLIALSTRTTFYHQVSKPLEHLPIKELLFPQPLKSPVLSGWKSALHHFKLNLLTYSASIQDPFIRALYLHHVNPYYIPPFVGVPLKLNIALETAPFIWQSYIFLEHFFQKKEGTIIPFDAVYKTILKKVQGNEIRLRNLPNIEKNLLPFAVIEYLSFLTEDGLLKKIKNHQYALVKPVKIANNMEEWLQQEKEFYQRHGEYN